MMMTEMTLERLRAHRNNIHRYQRLLKTRLSDLERAYVARRLKEERVLVESLLRQMLPNRLSIQHGESSTRESAAKLQMDALLHPADAFVHPMDVVEDCDLTTYEKRAILSSWAADACAVKEASEPTRSTHGATVSFDDIVDALRILDSDKEPSADLSGGQADTPPGKDGATSLQWDC
ncbi:hypothetical protein [Bradyrhizobium roseum]|uniref:hypothetical protein n=1 Tax=Bradyrhizobium roseum TaxID=3056648 RepID=UPI0026049C61|nr:hypothetical protein [Bradyrhizobium roseus]WKA26091.1 hypothetical protein QUH67_20985 [Bradyrhizobium roseus]